MLDRVAVVSHDAGGAEILSSWLRQNHRPYHLVIDGPAIKIFERKLGPINNNSLRDAIKSCDWVLCGTSWQSDLEKQAIIEAKNVGKKVVTYLDHWVNYSDRFRVREEVILPDEIWVGDLDAKSIAEKTFPETKIVFVPNPYFEDIKLELRSLPKPRKSSEHCSILYVCEPIREHAMLVHGDPRFWGYTEEEALQYFLKNMQILGCLIDEVKIRPHPSEKKEKYTWVSRAYSFVREIESNRSLIDQIVEADVVVGSNTMAMVIALLANKRVICSIPPGGSPCALPQSSIEHMQAMVLKHHKG